MIMSIDLKMISLIVVILLVLFTITELLYHKRGYKGEITRKLAHVATGVLSMFFPFMLQSHWSLLLLSGSFLLLLQASKYMGILKSINDVVRVSHGSILFPVSVYTCFLAYQHFQSLLFYLLPIMILTICDPLSALIGRKYKWKRIHTFGHSKDLSGTMAFFLLALIIAGLFLLNFTQASFLSVTFMGVTLASLCALVELISHSGLDNLSIPYILLFLLYLFNEGGFLCL